MKKAFLICTLFFLLVGCSDEYAEFDLIDTKDPFDERKLIEQTMDEQRKLLKLGFTNESENWDFEFYFQETAFNQETEELTHKISYIHFPTDTYMSLQAERKKNDALYDDMSNQLKDTKPLENTNGYVGYTEEEGKKHYQFIVKEEDVSYYFENDAGALDENLVTMIANSLKTEGEGAHSHFYDRFNFKLDDIHFPQLSKEVVKTAEVRIFDLGHWAYDNNNIIQVSYELEDGTTLHFENAGVDLHTNTAFYTESDQEDTPNGMTVTTLEPEHEDYNLTYIWEADGHYYILEVDGEKDAISTEEVYAMIDSSRDDKREFSDDNVFESLEDSPTPSKLDKEILDLLSEMDS